MMVPQDKTEVDPSTNASHGEKEKLESSSSARENESTEGRDLPLTEGHEYLSGIKLMLVLASTTLASFLILLDMAIIATVCSPRPQYSIPTSYG
jgi:hypothetical protein